MEYTNLRELTFQIETIKSKSETEINQFLNDVVSSLDQVEGLADDLQQLLAAAGFPGIDRDKVVVVALLGCMLASIASQMSPMLREANIAKIRSISAEWSVDYNQLKHISEHSNELGKVFMRWQN
jgi:hypothetical protein